MDEYLIQSLAKSPKVIERILRVFPHDRLDDRVESDRFTAREVVAHLADYEQTILDRIRVANQKPGHNVPSYDPDQRSSEHGFGEKEVFHEAEVFESRRAMTLEYVGGLSEGDMDKAFTRANGTEFTIRGYLQLIMAHDMDHIEQISAYLATEAATIS